MERQSPAADVSLVALLWLTGEPSYPLLCEFKRRFPTHPVVLVTTRDAENADLLKTLLVEQVVWTTELEKRLPLAIQHAAARHPMLRLAEELERAAHLPIRLRRALALACRRERPFRTVGELADAVDRDRRTLSVRWTEVLDPGSVMRLEDFVDWLLLLQAAARWAVGWKATAVAADLGVHAQTLSRTARRLAETTPSQIRAAGRHQLIRTFRERAVIPLLGEGAWDVLQ